MSSSLWLGLLAALFPLVGVALVRLGRSPASRRSLAVAASVGGTASAVGVLLLAHEQSSVFALGGHEILRVDPWSSILPALANTVGLANSLSIPTWRATPAHIGRRLALIALANVLFLAATPWLVPLVWGAKGWLLAQELEGEARTDGTRKVFWASIGLAVGLAAAGALTSSSWPFAAAVLLAVAAWVREAAFPFHSWLVAVNDRAPLGLVTLYVAPQTGVYVMVRWVLPVLSDEMRPVAVAVGGLTAVFGALMAVALTAPRRRLAWLWISQTALVALGLEASSPAALAGGLVCWVTLGLATAGFGLNLSMVEARRGPDGFLRHGAGLDETPALAFSTLALGLASVGLPFTFGFIAEDLLIQGIVEESPALGLTLILATALNGITVMSLFFHLFGARRPRPGPPREADLLPREKVASLGVLALLLILGLAPGAGLRLLLSAQSTAAVSTSSEASGAHPLGGHQPTH